jgi:hypothetical protein
LRQGKEVFPTDSPLEGGVRSEPVSEIGLFRAILDGNKLVFGAENREEPQPWLAIVWRVTASKPLGKRAFFEYGRWAADEFTVYKKGGRSGHTLFQTENAISFSYLPILTGLRNLP